MLHVILAPTQCGSMASGLSLQASDRVSQWHVLIVLQKELLALSSYELIGTTRNKKQLQNMSNTYLYFHLLSVFRPVRDHIYGVPLQQWGVLPGATRVSRPTLGNFYNHCHNCFGDHLVITRPSSISLSSSSEVCCCVIDDTSNDIASYYMYKFSHWEHRHNLRSLLVCGTFVHTSLILLLVQLLSTVTRRRSDKALEIQYLLRLFFVRVLRLSVCSTTVLVILLKYFRETSITPTTFIHTLFICSITWIFGSIQRD